MLLSALFAVLIVFKASSLSFQNMDCWKDFFYYYYFWYLLRSRSYQGHTFQEISVLGTLVFQFSFVALAILLSCLFV